MAQSTAREDLNKVAPQKNFATPELLDKVRGVESSNQHIDPKTKRLTRSSTGAEGAYQILPSTQKRPGYGVPPVRNRTEVEHRRFAGDYLNALSKRYGDDAKAVVAYNQGPGTVDRAVREAKATGTTWYDALESKEGRDYLVKVLGAGAIPVQAVSQASTRTPDMSRPVTVNPNMRAQVERIREQRAPAVAPSVAPVDQRAALTPIQQFGVDNVGAGFQAALGFSMLEASGRGLPTAQEGEAGEETAELAAEPSAKQALSSLRGLPTFDAFAAQRQAQPVQMADGGSLDDLGDDVGVVGYSSVGESTNDTPVAPQIKLRRSSASKSMGSMSSKPKKEKEDETPKGSARQQLQELQYKTGLTTIAIKDKLRGLGADTFGAPTLTSSRGKLTRGPLSVASFDEGGDAKKGVKKDPVKDPVSEAAGMWETFKKYGEKARNFMVENGISPTDIASGFMGLKKGTALGLLTYSGGLNEGEDEEVAKMREAARQQQQPQRFAWGGTAASRGAYYNPTTKSYANTPPMIDNPDYTTKTYYEQDPSGGYAVSKDPFKAAGHVYSYTPAVAGTPAYDDGYTYNPGTPDTPESYDMVAKPAATWNQAKIVDPNSGYTRTPQSTSPPPAVPPNRDSVLVPSTPRGIAAPIVRDNPYAMPGAPVARADGSPETGETGAAYGNPNLAAQGEKTRARKALEQINRVEQQRRDDVLDRVRMQGYNPVGSFQGSDTDPQTLDEAAGLDPKVDRSTFLPYSKKEGWHVPSAAADLMKLATASDPRYSHLMRPEDAVPLSMNLMGGGMGASMATKAAGPGTMGMFTYHGSPHRFPPTAKNPLGEFDPMKIGTGQGAQTYGHGLYVAENPKVAGGTEYRDPQGMFNRLAGGMNNREEFAHDMISQGRKPAEVFQIMKQKYGQFFNDRMLWADLDKVSSARGNLYKVDLPDEQIAKMLDWDKPLSQQPEIVNTFRQRTSVDIPLGKGRAVQPVPRFWYHNPKGRGFDAEGGIASYNLGREGTELSSMFKEPPKGFVYLSPTPIGSDAVMVDITKLDTSKMRFTGQSEGFAVYGDSIPRTAYATSGKDLYGLISHDLGGDPRAASKTLKELGIPGIRYLDQGSRAAPSSAQFVKADVVGAADDLTALAKSFGLDAEVRHSGSNAGKSSYITVFDPMTNRYIKSSFRISDHGTGPLRYQDHINISSPADLAAQKNDLFEWVKRNRTEKGVDTTDLRAPSQGTSNFVVFDPAHMNIIERNELTLEQALAGGNKATGVVSRADGSPEEGERSVGDRLKGYGETAASLLSGLGASIPAGYSGLVELARTRDPEKAAEEVGRRQAAMTYEPRTASGKKSTESAAALLENLSIPAQYVGGKAFEASGESPLAGAAAETLLDPLNFIPGAKAVGKLGKKGVLKAIENASMPGDPYFAGPLGKQRGAVKPYKGTFARNSPEFLASKESSDPLRLADDDYVSNLEKYNAEARKQVKDAGGEFPETTPEQKQAMQEFYADKAMPYFEELHGTLKDPVFESLMEGRITPYGRSADEGNFRPYMIKAAKRKTAQQTGFRYPADPDAYTDITRRYDSATGLKPTLYYTSEPNLIESATKQNPLIAPSGVGGVTSLNTGEFLPNKLWNKDKAIEAERKRTVDFITEQLTKQQEALSPQLRNQHLNPPGNYYGGVDVKEPGNLSLYSDKGAKVALSDLSQKLSGGPAPYQTIGIRSAALESHKLLAELKQKRASMTDQNQIDLVNQQMRDLQEQVVSGRKKTSAYNVSDKMLEAMSLNEPVWDIASGTRETYGSLNFLSPEHLNDYMRTLPPEKIRETPFTQMVEESSKYQVYKSGVDQLVKDIKAGRSVDPKVFSRGMSEPVKTYDDGFRWVKANDETALKLNGMSVGHCLKGGARNCSLSGEAGGTGRRSFDNGDTEIYFLQDARGVPVTTLEVINAKDPAKRTISQTKGNGTKTGDTAPVDYDSMVYDLAKQLNPVKIIEREIYLSPSMQQLQRTLNTPPPELPFKRGGAVSAARLLKEMPRTQYAN